MRMNSCGISDIGRHREVNEDSFLADDSIGLYIVADGVGGHAKGEVASAQAVEEVHGYVCREYRVVEQYLKTPTEANLYRARRLFESAVQSACYMVFGLAELDPSRKGMSTTMSALLVMDAVAIVAQVGDSRVYRLRSRESTLLTEDHTLVNYKLKHGLITPEEAENEPGRHVITRAVGHRDYVQVDTFSADVRLSDRFLLCSDGLHGYLSDQEVSRQMAGELEMAAQHLIDLANERGGRDNITVLLVDAQ